MFANEARRQALLVAKFDNLGKGASGAAVQNLMLMLGRCRSSNAASTRMRRAGVQHQAHDKANDRLHDQAGDIGERGAEQACGDDASGHRAAEVE